MKRSEQQEQQAAAQTTRSERIREIGPPPSSVPYLLDSLHAARFRGPRPTPDYTSSRLSLFLSFFARGSIRISKEQRCTFLKYARASVYVASPLTMVIARCILKTFFDSFFEVQMVLFEKIGPIGSKFGWFFFL